MIRLRHPRKDMRRYLQTRLLGIACTVIASTSAIQMIRAQESSPSPVKIFSAGPEISPPQLMPLPETFEPPKNCKKETRGKVVLGAIIDAKGKARNLHFLTAQGSDLDRLALLIAAADNFTPAMQIAGSPQTPVATAQILDIQLSGCYVTSNQADGTKTTIFKLKTPSQQSLSPDPKAPASALLETAPGGNGSKPINGKNLYQVGKGTTPPKLIKYEAAEYSTEARAQKIQGTVMLSIVVDENGMPRDIKIVHGVDQGLDAQAIIAVSHYRFAPAIHDTQPVAVSISVQVNFRLY